ncbi:MAG: type II secretion system F family protein [Acidobacteria bacterium]|nr:type II secretion system F family protein [Acidobacteriota bacterium]
MLSLLLLATAVLAWPAAAARSRMRRPMAVARWVPSFGPGVPVVACAGVVGAVLAGAGGALAGVAASATAWRRWRARGARRDRTAAATGLVDALGLLVAELRAGAHPAAAAEAAARDAHPGAAAALGTAAAAARLGGDVPAVLHGAEAPALHPWLGRIADAWALADRHGVPLADLLEAVRVDVEHRARFAADVDARLAGPRATAAVLAGLPALGLLLGQAIGADPFRVLAGTGPGQLLLVVGTGLVCAGVSWSARIVAGAVPT